MEVPEGVRQGCSEFHRRFPSSAECGAQVWGLQEVPRAESGWQNEEHAGWTFLQYRAESMWRGTAIGYKTSEWAILKRTAHGRGFWVRMRHVDSGVQMRMGTAHFTQGCQHMQHVSEVQACFEALPPTALPAFLAADSNASIGWHQGENGEQQAFGKDGKGVAMLDVMSSREMQVADVQEEQSRLPTSRPRKQGVQGKVIDFIAAARAVTGPVWVEENSCHIIGTGHELIVCTGYLQKSQTTKKRFDCRPRVVVGEIPEQREYNQQVLRDVAAQCTRVARGRPYKDPDSVKAAFRRARVQRTAAACKQAQRARRQVRAAWEKERLDGASQGNWQDFRMMRKKGGGWETHFAEAHENIHKHLQDIYDGEALPPFPEGTIQDSPLFTLSELKEAVGKGRLKKAVGTDMVPHELLVAICEKDDEAAKLLDWMNHVLATGEVPKDWGEVVMIVLAKISRPELVKQV